MPVPGPSALGRSVVITSDDEVPAAWDGVPVITIDEVTLAEPSLAVSVLHEAWSMRHPIVIRLAVDPARFREPPSVVLDLWLLGPRYEVWADRLHFLVWANTYDARGGIEPVWWWARKAERLGAVATPAGVADVELPDGTAAWIDGGPRSPIDLGVIVHAESVELGRLTVAPEPVQPTADLAPDQLAAVSHGAGPARVIAPAGSGKTRVLTERLRHLIVDRGVESETTLAVAYNKKAQEELEQRCSSFRPRVQTLNALAYALLRQVRGRAPQVVDEREVRRIIEDLVPHGPRRVNTDPIGPYLEGLSSIRLGLRDPQEVEDARDDVPGLADAFGPYRERLAAAGAVDFDEQIYGAIEVLLADGAFRRRAQAGCRHLLVDEFQDLTPAHVLLLRLLASPGLDVFGVGDDDQVIYGHAGADPSFLVEFSALFPGAADHPLEVNYRCPVAVVDGARSLLSYNRLRVAKEIRSGPSADAAPEALVVIRHSVEDGASALARVVQGWLSDDVGEADVAVLARVSSLLLAPHVALAEAGVPIDSVLRPDVLDRTGVRAALAYLRIAADPAAINGADLIDVYRRPSRGFPQWITKWFRGTFTTDKLRALGSRIDDAKVVTKLDDLVDDLELVIAAARGGTTRAALAVIKDGIGLGSAMGLLDGVVAGGGGGSSHLDDLEALEQVATLHPDPVTFEPWLRSVFHREAEPGGVTLSTIHRVKGREWARVAVFGVSAGIMPHRLAEDREEERRVFHVAITRGRHRVAVLADAGRPSPFLAELDGTAPHTADRQGDRQDTDRLSGAASRPRQVTPRLKGSKDVPAQLTGAGAAAEEALRTWRSERSRRDGVPAYIVLNDKHLRGIAAARPATLRDLRALDGIGPAKLDSYGDEILAVIDALSDAK